MITELGGHFTSTTRTTSSADCCEKCAVPTTNTSSGSCACWRQHSELNQYQIFNGGVISGKEEARPCNRLSGALCTLQVSVLRQAHLQRLQTTGFFWPRMG